MSAKINSAESIRGLACLAVVFSHLAMSFFPFLHHFDPNEKTDLAWVYAIHHLPFGFLYSGDAAVFVFIIYIDAPFFFGYIYNLFTHSLVVWVYCFVING